MPRASYKISKGRKGIGGRGKKKIPSEQLEPSLASPSSSDDHRPRPHPLMVSSSAKKIDYDEYDFFNRSNENYNEVIDISTLSERLLCKGCKKNGLQIRSTTCVGLASNLELFCSH